MTTEQLWWLSLGAAAIVIVVVAVLLALIIAAAKSIDRHATAIWIAGKQIAGNTVAIWMLEGANASLRGIRGALDTVHQDVAALTGALGGRKR